MERIWLGLELFSDCRAFLLDPSFYSLKNLGIILKRYTYESNIV
jgi:hypothetical protein